MAETSQQPRLLVFIVAYEAERTIEQVLRRIPASLAQDHAVEILVVDDASKDRTFDRAQALAESGALPFRLHVLANPGNQGYGGNQKIGFRFAIEQGFDVVALVHGDGQYAPEYLPSLLRPLIEGEADAVMGSRMLIPGGARKGGMPLYKFVGNRILTAVQNRLLRARLSEFHSGYRLYSTAALKRIPFDLNANGFHFDTEIIVQLLVARLRLRELPIPTYYGDEVSRVNGLRYAWNVTLTSLRARVQELGLLYDRKLDCAPDDQTWRYEAPRLHYDSPHRQALRTIRPGAPVLVLGNGLSLAAELRRRGCFVAAVAADEPPAGSALDEFHRRDLEEELPVDLARFEFVLLLDVVEHLSAPEAFVDRLRHSCRFAPGVRIVVSSANIGFFVTRFMLLLGQFNYAKRGILDLTHRRLFTFRTLARLFEQGGFDVGETYGIAAPFPLAFGDRWPARGLLAINRLLIRVRRRLFAYQIFFCAAPRPSLEYLLQLADAESRQRKSGL
jgi:glycosyltransferase involved in cell wall biosynthesis/2-polyprenyl-3-methyl-5-hydroxy-6-metoxy-1,4-benzoquinol methylase